MIGQFTKLKFDSRIKRFWLEFLHMYSEACKVPLQLDPDWFSGLMRDKTLTLISELSEDNEMREYLQKLTES